MQMVVLGSWPYIHTVTLDSLYRNTGERYLYYVDQDKIVREKDLPSNGITIDGIYHIAYGEEIGRTIDAYKSQIIPPPEPQGRKLPGHYEEDMDKIRESGLCLIVNGQNSAVMEGIGASWNQSLGTWICDAEHLSLIRDRRKRKFDGKVHKAAHVDMTYKIWGDLSAHVEKLKAINAIYNEEEDFWVVKTSQLGKIAHIFSK